MTISITISLLGIILIVVASTILASQYFTFLWEVIKFGGATGALITIVLCFITIVLSLIFL